MPFSTEVGRILETASNQAKRLHHKHVGSEHLLLGILHEPRSLAARLLDPRGVSADAVVDEIARAQEARRRYEEFAGAVKAAVDAADPVGLLRTGAPKDEYEPQVNAIVPRVAKADDASEVLRILDEEFVRCFGADSAANIALYDSAAREIWQAVLSLRRPNAPLQPTSGGRFRLEC